MQGAIARGARCPKIRRATFGCPAVRVRVPRSLCGGGDLGKRCSSAPAMGEGARDDPRPGVVRATGQERSELRPGAPAPASPSRGENGKRGSVAGAVALIVGTSIGSGILAVPQRTAPAGFVPSAACMVTCWVFLVAEALLIAEINVHLRRRRRNKDGGRGELDLDLDLEVISVKSMAQETLGEWGGHLAAATYLFLSYTSMVAYASKSGEVLSRLLPGVPEPVSGAAFTAALAMLVAGGGTAVTDRVNQLLTFVMIGLGKFLPLPRNFTRTKPRAETTFPRSPSSRLVTDPSFIRRFHAHHWRPLGVFFVSDDEGLSLRYISDPRYPAPSERFSVRVRRECQGAGSGGGSDDSSSGYAWVPHGCRHGRVVLSHSRYGHGTGTRTGRT